MEGFVMMDMETREIAIAGMMNRLEEITLECIYLYVDEQVAKSRMVHGPYLSKDEKNRIWTDNILIGLELDQIEYEFKRLGIY